MKSFQEYLIKREVSYNPLERGAFGDTLKYSPNLLTHPVGSAVGLAPAAVSGAADFMPTLNHWLKGNPYPNEMSGAKAFENGRDWLLKFAKEHPKFQVSKGVTVVPYLAKILDNAQKYLEDKAAAKSEKPQAQIGGVTLGQQPGVGSKLASPFAAAGSAAMTSLKNIRDTLDFLQLYHKPQETEDELTPNVQKVLYGLDAMDPKKVLGADTLARFKNSLAQADTWVDPDSRIATSDPNAGLFKSFGRFISGKGT